VSTSYNTIYLRRLPTVMTHSANTHLRPLYSYTTYIYSLVPASVESFRSFWGRWEKKILYYISSALFVEHPVLHIYIYIYNMVYLPHNFPKVLRPKFTEKRRGRQPIPTSSAPAARMYKRIIIIKVPQRYSKWIICDALHYLAS